MAASETEAAIQAVVRVEWARLVAGLLRLTRDLGAAEELAQDALVAALEHWPARGVPDNPAAWLVATAKHAGLNRLHRETLLARKRDALVLERERDWPADAQAAAIEAALDDDVGDDVLRLMFTACHPVLSTEAQVALTLRLVGGLSTEEIARAFLTPEPTIAQRIVRAKRTLAEAKIPFEIPRGRELGPRLGSVLGVVYLIFNEGYAATAGDDLMRPALCEEALRLGRVLGELTPAEPEAQALVALMELTAARAPARTDPSGDPILLLDQDRARWDQLLIRRGLAAFGRAVGLARPPGPYQLQAEIAACHARARVAEETPWPQIAALYGELVAQVPSPVVELNRALAVAMVEGPAAGLALIDALAGERTLAGYHLLPSARAELLVKLKRFEEAGAEFERAAALTRNARQRERLLARAAKPARGGGG